MWGRGIGSEQKYTRLTDPNPKPPPPAWLGGAIRRRHDATPWRKKKAHSLCVREHINTAGYFCFEKRPPRNLDPKTANFASTTKKRQMPAPPPSVAIEPLTSPNCTADVIPPEAEAEVTRGSLRRGAEVFSPARGARGQIRGFGLNLRLRPSLKCIINIAARDANWERVERQVHLPCKFHFSLNIKKRNDFSVLITKIVAP